MTLQSEIRRSSQHLCQWRPNCVDLDQVLMSLDEGQFGAPGFRSQSSGALMPVKAAGNRTFHAMHRRTWTDYLGA
jgi:hypothetical protein